MAAAVVAVSTSRCSSKHPGGPRPRTQAHCLARSLFGRPSSHRRLLQTVLAAAGKPPGEAEERVPAWAKPGADEPPPWAREGGGAAQEPGAGQVPFYAYLLASAVTAIAAIGSIFEYTNQRPVFGIVSSDSALYAPLLGFFVFTGIPTSGFLWFKAVQTANREAEEQDRRDGFM
uniref:Uncharacterized protein n=1 Tax=Arundo donax TaxID=35708 RepID=A0A0A9G799_ARUDO